MSAFPISIASTLQPSDTEAVPVRSGPSISANVTLEKEWHNRANELLAIRRYRGNWDGFGADAPDPKMVDAAISFLHTLRARDEANPPMRVAIAPDGMIAIEWQKREQFLRAEIVSFNEVEWMSVIPGQETQFETESARPEAAREHVWQPKGPTAVGVADLSFAG